MNKKLLINESEFVKIICADFGLKNEYETTLKLPASRDEIRAFTKRVSHKVRIFNGDLQIPYMIKSGNGVKRNDEEFKHGIELRCRRRKTLNEVVVETKVVLKSKPIRIVKGNWWTRGFHYTYKNFCCESYLKVSV